eukprot:TRINITY_DN13161_c0_g1::TRINITY_DN13161_c0_g1_i1::g.31081::m.31081 TRINITY_DN13161_c0_g1::TRINITY_DN13161_c0_g1_i1::g.31081  ORF type:complete len:166 (+),score=15.12,NT-C2/PF10358.4/2.1e-12 TRINITY_DN13161_c0_g1_i1:60-557(+)
MGKKVRFTYSIHITGLENLSCSGSTIYLTWARGRKTGATPKKMVQDGAVQFDFPISFETNLDLHMDSFVRKYLHINIYRKDSKGEKWYAGLDINLVSAAKLVALTEISSDLLSSHVVDGQREHIGSLKYTIFSKVAEQIDPEFLDRICSEARTDNIAAPIFQYSN